MKELSLRNLLICAVVLIIFIKFWSILVPSKNRPAATVSLLPLSERIFKAVGTSLSPAILSSVPSVSIPPATPAPVLASSSAPFAGQAGIVASSSPIFAYAHTAVEADGKFFIGMVDAAGNPFAADQIVIFTDPADLSQAVLVHLSQAGAIASMVYDQSNDSLYFILSDTGGLDLYSLDPHTYQVSAIVSTTTIDVGKRPAIVSDGTYIYGITETDPSTVFKVRIADGALTTSSVGHIPNGHSAAIGIYANATELYFGGSMSSYFEKIRASDLASLATIKVDSCLISNDTPFSGINAVSGYVYLGCEEQPYGFRVRTSDMSVSRFSLPGDSFGLFVFGDDLYNTGKDGAIDVFPDLDISHLERYEITDRGMPFQDHSQAVEPNELLFSTTTQSLYFTAWWGVPGLYRVAMTTAP